MRLVKIPCNAGALKKKEGLELAPDAIIASLENYYLKEDGNLPKYGVDSIDIDNSDIERCNLKISEKISKLPSPSILIGGDHSITYPAFRAFSKNNPDAGLLVLDAHPDLENNFSPPTHEDYLKVLIEEGHVDPKNVIIFGVRNMDKKELDYLKKKKINFFDMKNVFSEGIKDSCDAVMAACKNFSSLYLSIDIDVCDPAFAPGTGYIEPGGLTSRELIYILQRIKCLSNLKMTDLVEVNPKKDVGKLTVSLAAKLITELC